MNAPVRDLGRLRIEIVDLLCIIDVMDIKTDHTVIKSNSNVVELPNDKVVLNF